MFRVLFLIAVFGPLLGFCTLWYDARSKGWTWITAESLKMYVDAAKTFLTAAGVAVAIVVASLGGKFYPPLWIVQRAVAGLVTCVVFAPITVLFLYRVYERASSRNIETEPKDLHAQGEVTQPELALLLLMAFISAEGFILGFLYLARIPFHLAP